MDQKSFLVLLYCLFFVSDVYALPKKISAYVRDYTFGERKHFVKQQELLKNDFQMIDETDKNTLVYKGVLLNSEVVLTYFFRQDRLTSIVYTWYLMDAKQQFFSKLNKLILKKYPLHSQTVLKSEDHEFSISFYSINKNKQQLTPTFDIELESFRINNPDNKDDISHVYTLEFRAADSDDVIVSKILLEDL